MDIENTSQLRINGVVGVLGRIVIPSPMRNHLKLQPGMHFTMYIKDQNLVIEPVTENKDNTNGELSRQS